MASTSKCRHCGGVVRSDEETCPHCGAENRNYALDTPRTVYQPRTIEELKEYCAERGMPLLRMRFFIGEDYPEPKAFGIYRDGKDVVVYKNKANGSRAVRYRGTDEAYAVNELFQKLLSECHSRGIYPDGEPLTRSACGAADGESGSRPASALPRRLSLAFGGGTALVFLIGAIRVKAFFPIMLVFFIVFASFLIPLAYTLAKRRTPARAGRSKPWVPWVLGAALLSSVLALFAFESITMYSEAQSAKRLAEYERLREDDGYYDFGDGAVYYSYKESWYRTSDFFEDAVWDPENYTWLMPDGSRLRFLESIWDSAGSTLHGSDGSKTFELPGGASVTLRLADGTVPEETQKAFLGTEAPMDLPFGPFFSDMLRENAQGYYDLGDGALYFLEQAYLDYSGRHTYKLYYTAEQGEEGSWYLIQEVTCPSGSWDPETLTLRDGSSVPYSAEARLARRYRDSLGFSQYSYSRLQKAQTGYYDFGDGRIYYRDGSGRWHHRASDSDESWSSGDFSYILTLGDGDSAAPDQWEEAYQGTDWDSDWGGSEYTSPSYSGSGSSSWDDDDDWDDWDSDDTDWDSDW